VTLPLLVFIDDSEADVEVACWRLGKAGLHVEHRAVETEQSLLVALAERLPDLILSDIVLPQWDWRAALNVCRALAPGVPFALYSGTVTLAVARQAMERGVMLTAEKDLPEQLIGVVKRALGIT
jgi:DNA-binding NtrC family response regulator